MILFSKKSSFGKNIIYTLYNILFMNLFNYSPKNHNYDYSTECKRMIMVRNNKKNGHLLFISVEKDYNIVI